MAGIYRGMVDDAHALLANSRADLWVVQKDTQGPYAESSSIKDDVVRSVRGMPGVAAAANVTYLTMQVAREGQDNRVMVVGIEPGMPRTLRTTSSLMLDDSAYGPCVSFCTTHRSARLLASSACASSTMPR
jgi:hypothetical protein